MERPDQYWIDDIYIRAEHLVNEDPWNEYDRALVVFKPGQLENHLDNHGNETHNDRKEQHHEKAVPFHGIRYVELG